MAFQPRRRRCSPGYAHGSPGPDTGIAGIDLYETGPLAWSEQQAEASRERAPRRDPRKALDLTHVMETISGVRPRELNPVQSFIQLISRHAIKCVADLNFLTIRHGNMKIDD